MKPILRQLSVRQILQNIMRHPNLKAPVHFSEVPCIIVTVDKSGWSKKNIHIVSFNICFYLNVTNIIDETQRYLIIIHKEKDTMNIYIFECIYILSSLENNISRLYASVRFNEIQCIFLFIYFHNFYFSINANYKIFISRYMYTYIEIINCIQVCNESRTYVEEFQFQFKLCIFRFLKWLFYTSRKGKLPSSF